MLIDKRAPCVKDTSANPREEILREAQLCSSPPREDRAARALDSRPEDTAVIPQDTRRSGRSARASRLRLTGPGLARQSREESVRRLRPAPRTDGGPRRGRREARPPPAQPGQYGLPHRTAAAARVSPLPPSPTP